MDYLLSREGIDAHESVRTHVARSVAVVDSKLDLLLFWFARCNVSFDCR